MDEDFGYCAGIEQSQALQVRIPARRPFVMKNFPASGKKVVRVPKYLLRSRNSGSLLLLTSIAPLG